MSERAQRLAERFERANDELIQALAGHSIEQWRATCTAEGWTVGVAAHHIAVDYPILTGIVQAVATGQPLPDLTPDAIDAFNAQHAAEHADCTKEETIALLRRDGAATAGAIRTLREDQFDRTAALPWMGGMEVSVEGLIDRLLIGHIPEHLAGIRAACEETTTTTA